MPSKLLVLAIATTVACGPKAGPAPIVLPGDGDAHVVKPPPPASGPADPWAGRTDLIAPPAPLAPTAIELPKIEELKLSNGLQVYVVRSPRLPVVAMQLAVRAGRMHEPRARLGVSELTADMLVKGTRRRSAQQLAQAIDFVGGTIAADSTFEATLISCSVLTKYQRTCLDLVPELVTQPAFPEPELAKLRDTLTGALRQRLDDPAALASAHAQNLLWGDQHVRGWINSEETLQAIRRDDLVAWHKTWFVPTNAMLVVTGDVDAAKLRGELERAFSGWRKAPVPPVPTYSDAGSQGLSGTRIRLVDKPGLAQAHVRIAQLGIKHDDPRFFDTLVWNYVLGGGGTTSRLARAVRGDGSVPYGASSSFDRNLDRGSLVSSTVTRGSDAIVATKRMLAEIARLAKEGPSKDEVAAAIANLTGGYGLRFQSAADLGASVVSAELHRFGSEYLTNYPVAVGAVDVASAKRAASEILDPKAYVVVIVGDAKDLEPLMKKEGWRYEKVSATEPVSGATARPPEVVVDPKAAAAARQLIDEAIAAKGGKPRLEKLRSFKLTAGGQTTIQGQTVPVEILRAFEAPDKMRIDATIKTGKGPDVVISVGVAGKVAWQRSPDGKGGSQLVDITGANLASVDFERWREPELILIRAADPAAKLVPAPDETIDGKANAVVKLRSPFGEVDVTLYIDKKTKLVSRMSYSDGGSTETDDFADYRDVSGVKIAHKRNSTGAGRSTVLDVKSVEVDGKLDPALFAKPAAGK
jgi:zinc protease